MDLKAILEALLFSAQRPLNPRELRDVFARGTEESSDASAPPAKPPNEKAIQSALEELAEEYSVSARSYQLTCVAGSWQFVTRPEYAPWVKALVGEKLRPPRLSQPALETLAIIAYRQPLTRAEIEQIRGVSVDGVLQTLLERALVEQAGRADVIGRPMTYGTTMLFLEYFGLRSLEELPAANELRRLPVSKPPSLLTADAGLATTPPESLAASAPGPAQTPLTDPVGNGDPAPAPAGVIAPSPGEDHEPERV